MVDISYMLSDGEVRHHECGHFAGFEAEGVKVTSIDVSGEGRYRGVVTHEYAPPIAAAKSILAAFLCQCGRVPAWPLDSGGETSADHKHLMAIAEGLKWDRAAYEQVVEETQAMMATSAFQRPYGLAMAALEQRPYLDQADIDRLLGRARPRREHRNLDTRWIQTKSASDAGARALRRVKQIENAWQDAKAREYEQEAA
jgi:hypothetical protein